jgi:hypothetical protein
MDSPYWTTLEQDTLALHRYARNHQLDADLLYMRDGVCFESNPEAFVDREVTFIGSASWNRVLGEMAVEAQQGLLRAVGAPSVASAPLPDDDEIACALATLGEDADVTRIEQVRMRISVLRGNLGGQTIDDVLVEVDTARRLADREVAAMNSSAPAARQENRLAADDGSLAPSM